jgi:hypothetical protein
VVIFISPTSTVLNLEGMDVSDVVTSNNTEETTTIDITAQQETTIDEDGIGNGSRVARICEFYWRKCVNTFVTSILSC